MKCLGEHVKAEGPFVTGAALVYNETFLHLSAFGHDGRIDGETRVPYQRFFQRRGKIQPILGFQ
jgi:hypothetical protein